MLETTSWEGDASFEFSNVLSDDFNGHLANALWLPVDYFDELPACADDRG